MRLFSPGLGLIVNGRDFIRHFVSGAYRLPDNESDFQLEGSDFKRGSDVVLLTFRP
jgi:hypothetical protein